MVRHDLVERALHILEAAGRTRTPGSHEWWTAQWKELAHVTHGLTEDDPRLNPLLGTMAVCDRHYKAQDLDGFEKEAKRVRRLMQFVPGATVRWEGAVGHRVGVLGPVMVEQVICSEGRLWCWVEWQKTGRWISEAIITRIEGPTA